MNVIQANFQKPPLNPHFVDIPELANLEAYDSNGNRVEIVPFTKEIEEEFLKEFVFVGFEKAEDGNEVPICIHKSNLEEYLTWYPEKRNILPVSTATKQ